MDNPTLKSKAVKGSIWSLIETFSLQFVQLVVGIILARILEPKDYGLIALTGIFSGITSAITDVGFEKTLIRKKNVAPLEINTVFYLNIILGLIMTVFFFFSAPLFSIFFHSPELTVVLRAVSIGFFINSLGQTQKILLIKELVFKRISYAQIASSVLGGISGVIMAYQGFGVWALVYSGLITQVIRVLFFWIKSPWYPSLLFSLRSIKEMIPYGSNILLSSILLFFVQQFNNLVVGRFYSKTDLGLFNRGSRFPDLVVSVIQSVILKMSFPIFSKLQEDVLQLKGALKQSIKMIAFISFPLLALMLINAEDITIVLFTEKWRNSIVFFQLFCIVRLLDPIITINKELILSRGFAKLQLYIFIVTSIFEISFVLIAIQFGIHYVIIVSLVSKILQYRVYSKVNERKIGLLFIEQFKWLLPYLAICVIIVISQYCLHYFIDQLMEGKRLLKLLISLTFGAMSYIVLSFLFRVDEVKIINTLLNSLKRGK